MAAVIKDYAAADEEVDDETYDDDDDDDDDGDDDVFDCPMSSCWPLSVKLMKSQIFAAQWTKLTRSQ